MDHDKGRQLQPDKLIPRPSNKPADLPVRSQARAAGGEGGEEEQGAGIPLGRSKRSLPVRLSSFPPFLTADTPQMPFFILTAVVRADWAILECQGIP